MMIDPFESSKPAVWNGPMSRLLQMRLIAHLIVFPDRIKQVQPDVFADDNMREVFVAVKQAGGDVTKIPHLCADVCYGLGVALDDVFGDKPIAPLIEVCKYQARMRECWRAPLYKAGQAWAGKL